VTQHLPSHQQLPVGSSDIVYESYSQ